MSEITDFITYEKFKRVVDSLSHLPPDTKISFEYVMTAFFPTIYNNILDKLNHQYTLGYLEGLNEGKRHSR